jgi:hypothetical protein
MERWLAITGIVFVVLLVIAVVGTPNNSPSANASAAKVVDYYHRHKNGYLFGAWITSAAVFVGIPYFWYLREYLISHNSQNRALVNLGFVGAAIFALSGTLSAGMQFALVDHVGKIDPTVTQTLNDLNGTFWNPMTAIGVGLFLLASAIAILRYHSLPTWLGWGAVVFAISSITVILGMLGTALFIVISSVILFRRASQTEAPQAGT